MLQLALSAPVLARAPDRPAGAPQMSLIAVWDGNPTGDGKGGTAHMVEIARKAGTVAIDVIKLKDGKVAPSGPGLNGAVSTAWPRAALSGITLWCCGGWPGRGEVRMRLSATTC